MESGYHVRTEEYVRILHSKHTVIKIIVVTTNINFNLVGSASSHRSHVTDVSPLKAHPGSASRHMSHVTDVSPLKAHPSHILVTPLFESDRQSISAHDNLTVPMTGLFRTVRNRV